MPTLAAAFAAAVQQAEAGERIVVFGSFFTVAEILAQLHTEELVNGR
jgi:folylpolyglutamate synthase/dihydropteroate synthase